jgi:hypothetical protein
MKQKLEEQRKQFEDHYQKMAGSNANPKGGPLLHARIPGAESEMSVFSKNDEGHPTRLPDIGRNTSQAQSELKNMNNAGQGSGGIADI